MDNKDVFNREKFADLLEKARGGRSINQFANETGVSSAHISRFLRKLIESPPTPETISKLVSKAYNDVTYQDMMIAAGHLGETEDCYSEFNQNLTVNSPINAKTEMANSEKRFVQIILADLFNNSEFTWSVEKNGDQSMLSDMVINIENNKYTKWLLDFKPTLEDKRFLSHIHFYAIYGQLSTKQFLPTDKYTIVVNSSAFYNQLINTPPVSIKANIFAMLIDLEKSEVVEETVLSEF